MAGLWNTHAQAQREAVTNAPALPGRLSRCGGDAAALIKNVRNSPPLPPRHRDRLKIRQRLRLNRAAPLKNQAFVCVSARES